MKVLIVYVSKSGTTAECAELLERELHGTDVTLANLADGMPETSGYDAVIAGSYVRFGKTDARFREFLSRSREDLLQRYLGLFLCCGEIQNLDDYVSRLIPAELRAHAFGIECFGGSLDLRRFRGIERFFVRMLRSSIENSSEHNEGQYEKTLPALLPENISRMATHFRSAVTAEKQE